MKNYLILLIGILAAGASVFFIKASLLAPASLSAVRLLVSTLVLSPLMVRGLQVRGKGLGWTDFKLALPGAVALTIHYATWFVGVRETTAALSTLIASMNPVMMPFLVYFMLKERITIGEIVGSVIAMAGVVLLALTKDNTGTNTTGGIIICIVSIFFACLYLAWGRRYGRGTNLFVYIVPLYFVAGLLSLGLAFGLREGGPPTSWQQILIAIGAAVVPTVIGHTALNHAMMNLPSQVVSIANLGQFFAVVLTILLFPSLGEKPNWSLIPPAVLVLGGALIVIRYATPAVKQSIDNASTEPAGT